MRVNREKFFAAVLVILASGPVAPLAAAEEPNDDHLQMIVDLLADQDKDIRALALDQVRTDVPGAAATKRFAAELSKLQPDAQGGLIGALADRKDAVARPAVLEALAAATDESVRVAAIRAIGALGEPSDTSLLVRVLAEASNAEKKAARASLVLLAGDDASQVIARSINEAPPAVRIALIEILTARRAIDSAPVLLTAAIDADATVRAAAMTALGQLAGPEQIPGMVQGILKAEHGAERQAAEKALALVCHREADADKRADALLAAMAKLQTAEQTAVLPALGRVGGPSALKTIEAVIAEPDPQQHDAGVRALCNWPDASVAPRLVELIEMEEHAEHQAMSLRALIRVAALPDARSERQRLEQLQQAMKLCARDEDRRLALNRAPAIRTVESLRFVLPYLEQPALAQQACESVVELAHHRGLREPNKVEFDPALDKVIRISNDPIVQERAQRYKNGQTWVRPVAPKST